MTPFILRIKSWVQRELLYFSRNEHPEEAIPLVYDSPHYENIKKARDYILEKFREDISSINVAMSLKVSPQWMCVLFKQGTGKTITACLNEVRIKEAKRLLQESDRSVVDIALQTGFHSLSHFRFVFYRHEKMSPTRYQKAQRKYNRAQGLQRFLVYGNFLLRKYGNI